MINLTTEDSASENRRNSIRRRSSGYLINESHFELLAKNPDLWTSEEHQNFMLGIESLGFFNKEILDMLHQNQLIETLIRSLKYESFEATKAIYHEGDLSESFYIVVKGKVRLYTPRPQDEIHEDKLVARNHSLSTTESSWKKSLAQLSPYVHPSNASPPTKSATRRRLFSQAYDISSPTTPIKFSDPGSSRPSITKKRRSVNLSNGQFKFGAGDNKLSMNPSKLNQESSSYCQIRKMPTSLSIITHLSFRPNTQQLNMIINKGISEEDQQILSEISKLTKKYLQADGICEFSMQRDVNVGETFGSITHKANARQETAVAFTSVQVLILPAKKYLEIFQEPIKEKKERTAIFQRIFSGCPIRHSVSLFSDLFKLRRYTLRNCIYCQGSSPDGLYMVLKGEVKISYKGTNKIEASARRLEKTGIHHVEVVRIGPYLFFGGEDLLGLETRAFTAECSSMEVQLLYLESSFIREPLHYTIEFLKLIEEMCQSQFARKSKYLEDIKERMDRKIGIVDEKEAFRLSREYHSNRLGHDVNSSLENRYKVRRVKSPRPLVNKIQKLDTALQVGVSVYSQSVECSPKQSMKLMTQYSDLWFPTSHKPSRSNTEYLVDAFDSNDQPSFVLYRGTGDSMNLELKMTRKKETNEAKVDAKPIPIGSKISLFNHTLNKSNSSKTSEAKRRDVKFFNSTKDFDCTPKSYFYSRHPSEYNESKTTLATNNKHRLKSPSSIQDYDEILEGKIPKNDTSKKNLIADQFARATLKNLFSQPNIRFARFSSKQSDKTNVISECLKKLRNSENSELKK